MIGLCDKIGSIFVRIVGMGSRQILFEIGLVCGGWADPPAQEGVVTILRNGHWIFEDYKQRMTIGEWREILLAESDRIIVKGRLRQLKGKSLGAGVVEVYKEPMKE